MSYPSLLTKDSLKVILCLTLSSVTLTVQSPNSNAANWGWPKGRPSVTTDLNWSYASRHTGGGVILRSGRALERNFEIVVFRGAPPPLQ